MSVTDTRYAEDMARPPLPGEWTFWCDAWANGSYSIPLGPVVPRGWSHTCRLTGAGNAQVTLASGERGLSAGRMTDLWSWRLWAMYAGEVVFCGAPTGVADEGTVYTTLTLTEITGYLAQRQWDYQPSPRRYTQVEQTAIARDIAAPVADVGVVIITEAGPGFPRDRSYAYLEGQNRLELLTNLANVLNGPEFRTEYGLGGTGYPEARLRIAYPRVGHAGPGLGAVVPGDAITYRAAWDADKMRTRTFAVGDLPEDAAEELRPVEVEDRPQAGIPRLDAVDDWPGTVLTSTLRERANTMAATYARPSLDLTFTTMESSPPLNGYAVGDDVTVNIVSPLLEGGLEVPGRLTELTTSAGNGTVTWTVATSLPPPSARETVTGRLDRLDRTTAKLWRRRIEQV